MAKNISRLLYDDDVYAGIENEKFEFDSQGWNSTGEAFNEVIKKLQPRTILEVGTWKGGSALNMAKLCLDNKIPREELEIVCIDTFLGSHEHFTSFSSFKPDNVLRKYGRPRIYEQFLHNVKHLNCEDIITPFPVDSINAALCLKQWKIEADLIYIDAGHDYDSVAADFRNYKELVRIGGYILIDDWHHPPIKEASKDVLGDNVFDIHGKAAWIRSQN